MLRWHRDTRQSYGRTSENLSVYLSLLSFKVISYDIDIFPPSYEFGASAEVDSCTQGNHTEGHPVLTGASVVRVAVVECGHFSNHYIP